MSNTTPTLVDLYSGCGGFGLGGELAGFHSIVAVDIDPTLQSAYRLNFRNTRAITADLSTMNNAAWQLLLKDIEIDGVIGGPPCQGYSRQGHNDPLDKRRSLLQHFFRNVNIISPKFFIMENVEGLMDKKNKYELDNAIKTVDEKYTIVGPFVVDASEFGAPTKRRRVVVIGYDPSRMAPVLLENFKAPMKKVKVIDAISDLPDPITKSNTPDNFGWAPYRSISNLSLYARKMRTRPKRGLGWKASKSKLKDNLTSGHFETVHSKRVAFRYASTPQGKIDKVSKSKKLAWNGLCPTLRAGTGSDKGSHQAVRPLHPDHGRVITVREAARLQGFPDWFCFHPTKWHSFRMIGNSVSPVVSEHLLKIIHSKLNAEATQLNQRQSHN